MTARLRSILQTTWPRQLASSSLAIAIVLGIAIGGCAQLRRYSAETTPITTVNQAAPTGEVYIRGKVVNQFSILGQGAYQVEDDSGSIWVTSDSGLPPLESTVLVKGTPRTGVTIGPRSFGVTLAEIERL